MVRVRIERNNGTRLLPRISVRKTDMHVQQAFFARVRKYYE